MTTARWFVMCVILLGGVAFSNHLVVQNSNLMRLQYAELQRVQQRQDELLAEYSRLQLERSARSSYQSVEQIAEAKLGMRFPEQVRYLDP